MDREPSVSDISTSFCTLSCFEPKHCRGRPVVTAQSSEEMPVFVSVVENSLLTSGDVVGPV